MSYIGNQPTSVAFVTDQFSGNGSTTAFTMSVAPANTASVLVAVSGVLQDPTTYSVSGLTLTFSTAPPSGTGNISARYLGIPASGVTTTAYRTVTEFTATASQTTFTPPSYTVGYINVYRNGVRLGSADYTASNGTTVVLATGASAGDLVTTESFLVSSVLNAIPNTAGSVSTSNLATSGTANAYSLLRGDSTWSSINGGATVTSSATDVTLTITSNRLQQIAMTAFGKNVILPDATTYPSNATGGVVFVISNSGSIAFDIAATDGGRFFGLAPGQTVEISLANNSNSKTGWVATPLALPPGATSSLYTNTSLLSYSVTAFNSTNSYSSWGTSYPVTCTALSTTSVLVTWIAASTGYVLGVVGTISGTTVTWGSVTTINSARAYVGATVTALSSTTALVGMQVNGGAIYWIGLAISGTSITPSTISAADNTTQLFSVAVATSTVVVSIRGDGTNLSLRAVTYNGASAPTLGTQLAGAASTGSGQYVAQIVPLNSTTFLATYYTGSAVGARCYTLAGTTLTAGPAGVSLTATINYSASLVLISATEALYISDRYWQKITVSGTTATAGAVGTLAWTWNSNPTGTYFNNSVATQLLGSTDFIGVAYYGGNYFAPLSRYSYNATSGSLNLKGISLCSNSLMAGAVCAVSSTQALVVGLSTQSDGNNNYYPAGYLVALNG